MRWLRWKAGRRADLRPRLGEERAVEAEAKARGEVESRVRVNLARTGRGDSRNKQMDRRVEIIDHIMSVSHEDRNRRKLKVVWGRGWQ